MTEDQKHCPHPLDLIVLTTDGRRCMDCGFYDEGWDEVLKNQSLPWPPAVQPAGHKAPPRGDSLAKVADSFKFKPDFSSWDGRFQVFDVVKLEHKLFKGLVAALRNADPRTWGTPERGERKWSEMVKFAGRELGDQDGFVRMVEGGRF